MNLTTRLYQTKPSHLRKKNKENILKKREARTRDHKYVTRTRNHVAKRTASAISPFIMANRPTQCVNHDLDTHIVVGMCVQIKY